ncbi:pectate lyase family protein [Peristeroidobacter agariperforans]|uniref:pectate lyase family protein n=1 Tax=Peristeroidobacter agariperforans TaxID=268404 RepID=UPI00101D2FF9|nr:pectate lyase [Peristeroidobacter agariperforans]
MLVKPLSLRSKLASLLLLLTAVTSLAAADNLLAFPGALGAAAQTPGGRGGKIIRVTTLDATGPGSLLEALETKGPRIVVFEVGGVIDMQKHEIKIKEPFLTVAGQTAPSPGITIIRTGIDVLTHDVILQHIRVRTGSAGAEPRKGWEPDAFSTIGAYNVIVDHCSMTWAVDENLSASGPRFTGKTVEEWRKGTSHAITFSNNIIAEGLRHSTHSKGEHSKGSLIHDNASDILIINNLYAHNHERNPLFKGGVHGMVINNLIYNPGPRAVHYNLIAEEWRGQQYQNGKLALIGNVLRGGPSTPAHLPLLMLGGSGDLEYYEADNIAVDWTGQELPKFGRYTNSSAKLIPMAKPALPFGVQPLAAGEVQDAVIRDAGARPWDRDPVDARIVADTIEGRGEIIDSENDVGGYPAYKETRQKFDEKNWDLRYMTPRDKK